ncbi:alpha/beta hydrolase [Desulfoluna spongiiphila]|uniref:Carboxylesterase n=1 Tax=Desulfoluna spongiiphila TaxID=419481 RepID=A0A1G5CTT7_9BACT|nr:alpha/beta fold hydrolase [Desulfoluna spongiiphila]SCY05794.1 carboxylesterase [Desulfoluna spongiiphila]
MESREWETLALKEMLRFYEEYETFAEEGVSKPRDIGAPVFLHHPDAHIGILLIHGFMAAPEEVREWAECLYEKGYTVYAPRLAGHGTSPADLAGRTCDEWMDSVDRGHAILKGCCPHIVVAGFSTGAGLALAQALFKPEAFQAVISVSAPLKFKSPSVAGAEALNDWNRLCRALGLSWFAKEFVTNHADNPHINYLKSPIAGLVQVKALMNRVWKKLPALSAPALIVQGKGDPKVSDKSGQKIFTRICHDNKTYREIPFHLHGIVRGPIALELFDEVNQFLDNLETP